MLLHVLPGAGVAVFFPVYSHVYSRRSKSWSHGHITSDTLVGERLVTEFLILLFPIAVVARQIVSYSEVIKSGGKKKNEVKEENLCFWKAVPGPFQGL
ncbi:hypothetical protein VN97_g3045 [Penicillium thymicola]|uniref:Uncharacterized protein n=1 Tax=Penicillium thymicola TaxID=293382 RepID=A0AAI9TNS6_PENTH|nr:hypothetical protein VN97_g3045 [Penicillium thymicola]